MKLKPGDVLLYTGTGFFSWVIRVKTWSTISHCEIYDGHGYSLASRDGQGVDRYPLRREGLTAVMRPKDPLDLRTGHRWFEEEARGQGYDWLGLLAFTSARWQGKNNGKMFCSEFLVRFLRWCGVDPFPDADADAIAPGQFRTSPEFSYYDPKGFTFE